MPSKKQILHRAGFYSQRPNFSAGLAGKFCQELATLHIALVTSGLTFTLCCSPTASGILSKPLFPLFLTLMALVTLCMTFTALSKLLLLSKQLPICCCSLTLLLLTLQCLGQCCRSGSRRIRNFWPDADPIRNQNKGFGSGFESDPKPGPK